jgi:hypothetical protein
VGIGQAGDEIASQRQQITDGPGSGPFVKAGIFFGGANQNPAIGPGHKIARPPQKDPAEERRPGIEQSNLATNGTDSRPPTDRLQQMLAPCSCRQEESCGCSKSLAGPHGVDPLTSDFEAHYGTAGSQADSQQLTTRPQRLEMPGISHLGHVG